MGECVLKYVEPCISYVRKLQNVVAIEDITFVMGYIQLLNASLDLKIVNDAKKLDAVCGFASIWAFGGCLIISEDGVDNRKIFSEWWRTEFRSNKIPVGDYVFDYYLNPLTFEFERWKSCPLFKSINYDRCGSKYNITVSTSETVRVSYWMRKLISESHNVMLCGPVSTGKTHIVKGNKLSCLGVPTNYVRLDFIQASQEENIANREGKIYSSSTIVFNYYTNSTELQTALESKLTNRTV